MSALLIVSSVGTRTALALDEPQVALTCRAAQTILSSIEKADTVTRVNLGKNYADALTLMFAGNARLAANHIASSTTSDITAQLDGGITSFKTAFNDYDDTLSGAITFPCQTDPSGFYNKLNDTRRLRDALHVIVSNLNRLLSDYSDAWQAVTEGTE
jgi:hypothetical protein